MSDRSELSGRPLDECGPLERGTMTIPVVFAGWGIALPERRLTNADLEQMVDTTDEWIVERSGIRERRIADPEESTASLGIDAGKAAIKHAGLGPEDIDLLVLSTATPEKVLPTTAAIVQDGIGLRCGAMDVNAACSGFVYAMVTASAFLATGQYRNILVIGAETVSRIIDQTDRATLVLFGDGAGAAVLQSGARPDRRRRRPVCSPGTSAATARPPTSSRSRPAARSCPPRRRRSPTATTT